MKKERIEHKPPVKEEVTEPVSSFSDSTHQRVNGDVFGAGSEKYYPDQENLVQSLCHLYVKNTENPCRSESSGNNFQI